jgi:hypothetical protein
VLWRGREHILTYATLQGQSGKNKGCFCYEDDVQGNFYQNLVDRKAAAAWWKTVKEQENPICQKRDPNQSEDGAPQHIQDGDASVEKIAKDWCASMNGKSIKNGGEIPAEFTKSGFSFVWLSASYRSSIPEGLKCGNEVKISGDDCFKSLMSAVTRCEPHQKITHGAAIAKDCVFYVSRFTCASSRTIY